jgi:hypothetical protein
MDDYNKRDDSTTLVAASVLSPWTPPQLSYLNHGATQGGAGAGTEVLTTLSQ